MKTHIPILLRFLKLDAFASLFEQKNKLIISNMKKYILHVLHYIFLCFVGNLYLITINLYFLPLHYCRFYYVSAIFLKLIIFLSVKKMIKNCIFTFYDYSINFICFLYSSRILFVYLYIKSFYLLYLVKRSSYFY